MNQVEETVAMSWRINHHDLFWKSDTHHGTREGETVVVCGRRKQEMNTGERNEITHKRVKENKIEIK
jgi:hypothetical protein